MVRLEWLHAIAARDRWWEEHVLLFEELRRVGKTFRYEWRCWDEQSRWNGWDNLCTPPKLVLGVRAHAAKKASMYLRLAEEAETRFKLLEKGRPVAELKLPGERQVPTQ